MKSNIYLAVLILTLFPAFAYAQSVTDINGYWRNPTNTFVVRIQYGNNPGNQVVLADTAAYENMVSLGYNCPSSTYFGDTQPKVVLNGFGSNVWTGQWKWVCWPGNGDACSYFYKDAVYSLNAAYDTLTINHAAQSVCEPFDAATSYLVKVWPLGIADASAQDVTVSLYPNPAVETVTFNLQHFVSGAEFTVSLFDLTGKKIRSVKYAAHTVPQITWDVADLPSGFYGVQFVSGNRVESQKLLVQ